MGSHLLPFSLAVNASPRAHRCAVSHVPGVLVRSEAAALIDITAHSLQFRTRYFATNMGRLICASIALVTICCMVYVSESRAMPNSAGSAQLTKRSVNSGSSSGCQGKLAGLEWVTCVLSKLRHYVLPLSDGDLHRLTHNMIFTAPLLYCRRER